MRKNTLVAILLFAPAMFGQRFELTPLVGGSFGGLIPVVQPGVSGVSSISLDRRLNFGLAAGFRFADHVDGEVLWNRQRLTANGRNENGDDLGRISRVTMNQLHGDVLLHYTAPEAKIRPFVLVGFGGGVLSSHEAFDGSISGFSFGAGAGVKAYLNRHFGIRVQGRYTLTNISNTRWCGGGSCNAIPNNVWLNQKEFSAGTIFRF
jgi:hypothetical protein